MTPEILNEIVEIIQRSKIKRERKKELTLELLKTANRTETTVEKTPITKTDDILSSEKELQMIVGIPGVSVSSKPKKDGRYQGYMLEDGKRKYFYGRSAYEVAKKIQAVIKQRKTVQKEKTATLSEKMRKTEKTPLFGEYALNWIEKYKVPNLKPKSVDAIRNALRIPLQEYKDTPIGDITTDMLQELLLSFKGERVRDMSKIYLTQIFEKATVQNIIPRNPCTALEIKKHKAKHKEALTIEEQNKFLNAVLQTKYSLLFRFLLATGMRIGEALALHKKDFDFKKKKVTVNKDVIWIGKERIEQDTPKSNAGNRTIPVPEDILREIEQLDVESDDHIIFPFTYNQIDLAMGRLAKELNIKVSAHILRHTYCTRLEEAGIPQKIKSKMMGHSSIAMTQNVYTDVQESYVNRYTDKITSAVFRRE